MKHAIMISSTVLDFKDIRKMLKEVLKDADFNVIISEDGDIIVDSDQTIYENCLNAVEHSDTVITLIGGRYGSLYDDSEEISITRQEYRHARQNNKKRLVFIEKSVWNARKIYQKYLEEGIEFKETGLVTDKRILDFIDEVCVNNEWVFQFDTIVDLMDRVKKQLDIINPQYELIFQPQKSKPKNEDGTLNYEIGFKNISENPLLEFKINLSFRQPVLSVTYDFSRSNVNLTGGKNLYDSNSRFDWIGQMLPTEGWIVFIIKSEKKPIISNVQTNYTGICYPSGKIIHESG